MALSKSRIIDLYARFKSARHPHTLRYALSQPHYFRRGETYIERALCIEFRAIVVLIIFNDCT